MTPAAVARLKRCHQTTVRRAIASGRLKATKRRKVEYAISEADAIAWEPLPAGRPRK